jgi:hypothetical protein
MLAKSETPRRAAAESGRIIIYRKVVWILYSLEGVCFMANAKIEFAIGGISFSSEGEESWVAAQLDKIISQAPALLAQSLKSKAPAHTDTDSDHKKPMSSDPDIAAKTLPAFLTDKNSSTNQVNKFLATAVWLEARGNKSLSTKDISSALKDAKQNKLTNAADCLAQNIKKGFCEKDGGKFFVTQVGKDSL